MVTSSIGLIVLPKISFRKWIRISLFPSEPKIRLKALSFLG
jgi:hypothetical protein